MVAQRGKAQSLFLLLPLGSSSISSWFSDSRDPGYPVWFDHSSFLWELGSGETCLRGKRPLSGQIGRETTLALGTSTVEGKYWAPVRGGAGGLHQQGEQAVCKSAAFLGAGADGVRVTSPSLFFSPSLSKN